MEVCPAINCPDEQCVRAMVGWYAAFVPPDTHLHLDVADGRFTPNVLWSDPEKWRAVNPHFPTEVHLMVEEPEMVIPAWGAAGVRRIVVHAETLVAGPHRPRGYRITDGIEAVLRAAAPFPAEVLLIFNPETSPVPWQDHLARFAGVYCLAVNPGFAGQAFQPVVVDTIRFLRRVWPSGTIGVDGGVNIDTARLVASLGVRRVAALSCLRESRDPLRTIEELQKLSTA